jgi:hypothetical protein
MCCAACIDRRMRKADMTYRIGCEPPAAACYTVGDLWSRIDSTGSDGLGRALARRVLYGITCGRS